MAKRIYGAWSEDDMHRALHAYRKGELGFNKCCKQYGIPKATFNRHLKGRNIHANEEIKAIGRNSILPRTIEKDLVNHILKLERLMFGVTITDVRKLAFQIAELNKIPHNFNKPNQMAGKKWFYTFRARYENIMTLREPQAISMMRAKGYYRENLVKFFNVLDKLVDENEIDGTKIYNVDELSITTVQTKCQKVPDKKEQKQGGSGSSEEHGLNATIVCCASASGTYVPPMLIFKRMINDEVKVEAPSGILVEISESGRMTSELFVKWLQHFVKTVNPSEENKVILVLDSHTTHSINLETLLLAENSRVMMLQLPGHTKHRVQPLDGSFFKSFRCNYSQTVEKWLRWNPDLYVAQNQTAGLVAEAYGEAATIENAVNGFKVSGIWPVDRTVFDDGDFYVADNPNQQNVTYLCEVVDTEQSEEPNTKRTKSSDDFDEINWVEMPCIMEDSP